MDPTLDSKLKSSNPDWCPPHCLALVAHGKSVTGQWLGEEYFFKNISEAVLGTACLKRALLKLP